MSAEARSAHMGFEASYRPEYCSPADLILLTPGARQVFCDFMWQFVGDPNLLESMRDNRQPHVTRMGYDGGSIITYNETQVSGYTSLGTLLHVRANRDIQECEDRYFVAVGDLKSESLSEQYVVDAKHWTGTAGELETVLYLAHQENASWPQECWPSIRLTHQGFYYSPGFEMREERVRGIKGLYDEIATKEASQTHLRAIQ